MDPQSIGQFRTGADFITQQLADLSFGPSSVAEAAQPRCGGDAGAVAMIAELKARRERLGWLVSEVSGRCGIDEQSLNEWERGLAFPRLDAAQRWAAVLGLHLALGSTAGPRPRGLRIDWQQHRIAIDGSPVRLTPMEWKALERLARVPGELVTHEALFQYLYGDTRHYRSQSTAIRVLITKLRRLLPLKIEAQWGKGYVVRGLEASSAEAVDRDEPKRDCPVDAEPRLAIRQRPAVVSPRPPIRPEPTPIRHRVLETDQPAVTRAVPAAARRVPCRAEELGVIERFLAERGVTRCPDVATIQQSPLPTLVWDKVKRKWVRPSTPGHDAG